MLLGLVLPHPGMAQEQDTTQAATPDSLAQAPPPRARTGPTAGRGGSSGGGSSDAVTFSARDSLVIVTHPDSADRGSLHGQAEMSYQGANLKAKTIEMNFQTSTMRATGAPVDTAALSRPTFQRGEDQSFTGKTLSFNLRTQRGRVVRARTQQQEGFVEGEAVKMYEDSTMFVEDGSYTTCNCPPGETPSYSLRSDKMKVRGRWIYTGPINLYLFTVPTPLWLPFGFLPNVAGRRSGPLPPRYGQDPRKGLFLRDWGWYFALNDYTDLQLRASIWSRGSVEVNPIFRYTKRYQYDGQLNLTYQRTRIGEAEDPGFVNRHSGQLRWQHSQTLSPTASIRGNVNLVTSSDFARRNSDNYNDAVRQEISSTLRYSKNWPGGGQNLNLSVRQRQNLQNGEVSMTLPSLNFSQRSFKPFDVQQAVGDDRWFEKITTSYDFALDNSYSFRPRDPAQLRAQGDSMLAIRVEEANVSWYEALIDRDKYRLATGDEEPFGFQATHRIPLSASFRVNRYNLNLSPNVRYSSEWHISTQRRFVRRDQSTVGNDTVRVEESVTRFVRGFYARRDISTGLSANTELYGLFPVSVGPFQGLRHRINPSISFRYRPNYNDPFWGRTRPLQYENGEPVLDDQSGEPLRYDILRGNTVRGSNEQRNLNFSLNNELETKYIRVDSTGDTDEETLKLLDFDLGASYNFAADSLKMSNIDLRARTTIRDFRVRASMTFSPYSLEQRAPGDGSTVLTPVDRYMISENPLTPVRLTDFRLNVGSSFRGGGSTSGSRAATGGQPAVAQRGQNRFGPPGRGQTPVGQQQRSPRSDSRQKGYLGSTLPWSLNFDFSYSFQKPARTIENQNATLNGSFSLNVTPLWSLQGRSGYDLIQNRLATTSINVSRDLGCWVMSFSWVPFGNYQSYSFNLQVKSGHLSQLLRLQIPNSGGDNRLGGFGSRLQGTFGNLTGGGRNPRF